VRICDFGNAMFVPESDMLSPGQTVIPGAELSAGSQTLTNGAGLGTLAYTAPEMFDSSESYTFAIDIYALGVLLFTIISGNQPFKRFTSNVQIILAIKRGFFNSNSQALVYKWKIPDPAELHWQFPNGEHVPQYLMNLVLSMTNMKQSERPKAAGALSYVVSQTCE
jgi:serine/threonine protein kinase